MLNSIAAMMLAALQQPVPTEIMPTDQQMASASVSAAYFLLPEEAEVLGEATKLFNAEGLRHADGSPPFVSTMQEPSVMAVIAGDGRMIMIMFSDGDRRTPPAMCRIRAGLNGSSPATERARRWCADKLGVHLAPAAPSPIGSN